MRIRTDLVSMFLDKPITYDLCDDDIDFFYHMPKIKFMNDGGVECGDLSDDGGF